MENNGGCDLNATCKNIQGGFECSCKEGYSGNGFPCNLAQNEKGENSQAVGIGVGVTFGLLALIILVLLILFFLRKKVNFRYFIFIENQRTKNSKLKLNQKQKEKLTNDSSRESNILLTQNTTILGTFLPFYFIIYLFFDRKIFVLFCQF